MTRRRDLKEKAYLIPNESIPYLKPATLSVRPLRLAFGIDAQTSKEDLLKYIKYNTSIWGGSSNLFFPLYNSTINDNWQFVLERYDPDKIIFCSSPEDQFLSEISDRVQPFFMWEWSDDVVENPPQDIDSFGSVPIIYIL